MHNEILQIARLATYDFRNAAHPGDPLSYLFDAWVPYYRLKWAIASYLRPRRILEVGVRFGYSARALLDASPSAYYLGLDIDSPTYGGQRGSIFWARHALSQWHADLCIIDTQQLDRFPGGNYDLIHIDGQQDGTGTLHDLELALRQASWILLDGYFWSRDNFLWASEFLLQNRAHIEHYTVIPGYAGELLIKTRSDPARDDTPFQAYGYGNDCAGYDAWKHTPGRALEDRLQAVFDLVLSCQAKGRVLDLGCGRGELAIALAGSGFEVTAVDSSATAIRSARQAADEREALPVQFICGDVLSAPLAGQYQVIVASNLIEQLSPEKLEVLLERLPAYLASDGVFLLQTHPNGWFNRYEHPRRLRIARSIGAYLPADPRSRFERMTTVHEYSPHSLVRTLKRHFPEVLPWFAVSGSANPFENLHRRFSFGEMRAAGDFWAIASRQPLNRRHLAARLLMLPMETPAAREIALAVIDCPPSAPRAGEFAARVRLTNSSPVLVSSRGPNPVHLSYHWLDPETERPVVFDGRRTVIEPALPPQASREYAVFVDTPGMAGKFRLRLTLVQEGVRWFDHPPVSVYGERMMFTGPAI
jgi:SAM-dependent methyltransferase